MSDGNVIQFPTKQLHFQIAQPIQRDSVEVMADGRVRISPEVHMDNASRQFWEAVEAHVLAAWQQTSLPRERLRVKLLAAYLDRTDPEWRGNIRRVLGG